MNSSSTTSCVSSSRGCRVDFPSSASRPRTRARQLLYFRCACNGFLWDLDGANTIFLTAEPRGRTGAWPATVGKLDSGCTPSGASPLASSVATQFSLKSNVSPSFQAAPGRQGQPGAPRASLSPETGIADESLPQILNRDRSPPPFAPHPSDHPFRHVCHLPPRPLDHCQQNVRKYTLPSPCPTFHFSGHTCPRRGPKPH